MEHREGTLLVASHDRELLDLMDTTLELTRELISRRVAAGEGMLEIRGAERVALTGRNGFGKTALLELIDGTPGTGLPVIVESRIDQTGYLRQRLDRLDDDTTVLQNVRSHALEATPSDIRAQLAGFHFRKERPDRKLSELSGGERFRVALADAGLCPAGYWLS